MACLQVKLCAATSDRFGKCYSIYRHCMNIQVYFYFFTLLNVAHYVENDFAEAVQCEGVRPSILWRLT